MNVLRPFFPSLLIAGLLVGCATAPTSPTSPEAAALAVLNSSADVHEKARACQELAVVGGPASVPALGALLNHEHLSDYARSGLEAIQHPSAGVVLRKALGELNGRQLAGVVNSLGVRREVAAVPDLQQLALDPKRGVAAEALASLGMIGTRECAKTLQSVLADGPADLRVPAAHASLTAAAQLAKNRNLPVALDLLDRVVRALPSGDLATTAQAQAAALRAKPVPTASK